MQPKSLVRHTRPEVGLAPLRTHLYGVIRSLGIANNPKLKAQLLPVLQKIEIALLLDQHSVVAVTGLQGVGKTTIIREIYDIPSGILPEVTGRGEKLPVWIIENAEGDDDIRAVVIKATIDQEHALPHVPEVAVDHDDIKRIATDPEADDFLLKLYVPPRFFRGTARSFLLLPGIEQEETPWVRLAHYAMACSDAAVFVTNDTNWARAATDLEFERVRDRLRGNIPVIALSFSDQSPDGNEAFKATVAKTLQIDEDDSGRIVATRPGDKEWVGRLRQAIDQHTSSSQITRYKQLEYLGSLLQEEVHPALAAADQAAESILVKLALDEYQGVKRITDVIELEVKSLRKEYVKALDDELEAYQTRAASEVRDQIKKHLNGKLRTVRETAFGENGDDRRKLGTAVSKAWRSPKGDTLDRMYLRVLNKVAPPRFVRYGVLADHATSDPHLLLRSFEAQEDTPDSNGRQPLIRTAAGRASRELELDENILHDIRLLLRGSEEANSMRLYHSARVLPALVLEAVRLGVVIPQLFDLQAGTVAPKDQLDHVSKEFGELRKTGSGMFKGIGLMFGLDFIPDGEFNLISDVFKTAGVSAAAAGSLATGIVATVAVGYAAVSVGSALNRMALDRESRAQVAIGELRDRTRQRFIDAFDHLMDNLVEHVRSRLIVHYRLDEGFALAARLRKSLADSQSVYRELDGHVQPLLYA